MNALFKTSFKSHGRPWDIHKEKTLATLEMRPYVNGFPLGYYDHRTLCVMMIYGLYINSKFEILFKINIFDF